MGFYLPPISIAERMRQQPWREMLALLMILTAGALHDAAALFAHPFALGMDGYYYVLQVDDLQTNGRLYFHTRTPLILYALAGLSHLVGDPILSIKLGSIVLHAALCLGIFAIVTSVTRSRRLGALGSAVAAASGAHFYMIAEYINQLGALVFLTWLGWCVVRARRTRNRMWLLASALCLGAASLSHRSAPAIALAVGVSVALMQLLVTAQMRGHWPFRAAIFLVLALLCAPALLAAQTFVGIPSWIRDELTFAPRLPLTNGAPAEQMILMVAAPVTLVAIFFGGRNAPAEASERFSHIVFGSIAVWALLVTLNPFLNDRGAVGISWRLSVLAYYQAALLVPGLFRLILPRSREVAFYAVAVVLPLMFWSAAYTRPFGLQKELVSSRAELLRSLPDYRQRLGPEPLVVSRHGEQFVVTAVLGIPSQQRYPEGDAYGTIYWLLHRSPKNFVTPSMFVVTTDGPSTYIVLAKDDEVKQQLKAIKGVERRRLLEYNPHLLIHLREKVQAVAQTAPS